MTYETARAAAAIAAAVVAVEVAGAGAGAGGAGEGELMAVLTEYQLRLCRGKKRSKLTSQKQAGY